jgi:hypothetical protein
MIDATFISCEKHLCRTTCMSVEQTRPSHLEVGQHLGFGPIMPVESKLMHYSYWQEQSKFSVRTVLAEFECLPILSDAYSGPTHHVGGSYSLGLANNGGITSH